MVVMALKIAVQRYLFLGKEANDLYFLFSFLPMFNIAGCACYRFVAGRNGLFSGFPKNGDRLLPRDNGRDDE